MSNRYAAQLREGAGPGLAGFCALTIEKTYSAHGQVVRLTSSEVTVAVLAWLTVTPGFAQQFERDPPPKDEARPQRYLTSEAVDFRGVLAPPPAPGSIQDSDDVHAAEAEQGVAEERWRSAQLDSEYVYPRFEEAFGRAIDRKNSPALISVLDRALRHVALTTFAAKDHFQRPRPFQRLQLQRVCGEEKPPRPQANPMGGSSYPSGHSAYGWAVAMILARVAPDRAEVLMARAAEYAESRVVCGVHFPSDVVAGQVIAAAVVAHLDASSDFQADLARARAELSPHSGM